MSEQNSISAIESRLAAIEQKLSEQTYKWMSDKTLSARQLEAALAEKQSLKQAMDDIELRIQQLTSEAAVKTILSPPQVKDGEYSVNFERIPAGLQAL